MTQVQSQLPPVRRPAVGVDRDMKAEKAATMVRKGASIEEICEAISMSRSALKQLAQDYDFRFPTRRSTYWPDADDPGLPSGRKDDRQEAWARAKRAAAQQRSVNERLAKKPLTWPKQPGPVFYDHCEPTVRAMNGATIIREVCAKHRLSKEALIGPLRRRDICAARHEAAFRMVVELGYGYPKTGRLLGNRDHTTIINSVKRHASNDPAAALAFRRYCAAMSRTEEELRQQAIRLHFGAGASVNSLVKRMSVSRVRLMGWLLDEADARRKEAA